MLYRRSHSGDILWTHAPNTMMLCSGHEGINGTKGFCCMPILVVEPSTTYSAQSLPIIEQSRSAQQLMCSAG